MPLYEYACTACDHRFEILQRLGEGADGLDCPACGAHELEKQLSTFAANATDGGGSASLGAGAGRGAPACGTGFT